MFEKILEAEEFLEGATKTSPSVQLRTDPHGEVATISTHPPADTVSNCTTFAAPSANNSPGRSPPT